MIVIRATTKTWPLINKSPAFIASALDTVNMSVVLSCVIRCCNSNNSKPIANLETIRQLFCYNCKQPITHVIVGPYPPPPPTFEHPRFTEPGKRLNTDCNHGSVGSLLPLKSRQIGNFFTTFNTAAQRISLRIGDSTFQALFDTGAARSLLHENLFRKLPASIKFVQN